jgi:parallel beta-helix repeat protein
VAGAGNVIANNGSAQIIGGNGVFVESGRGNTVSGNSIYGNSLLGIDLGDDGITANDPDDADAGANDLQNVPTITSASTNGTAINVAGSLASQPRTTFAVELFASPTCDPSGSGEGRQFLGTTVVSTDHLGDGDFDATFAVAVPSGQRVTATAADPNGSTSEFSVCKTAAAS